MKGGERAVTEAEARLVALYEQRNEQAIAETQHEYGGYCYDLAYRILENREDTEECVNDALLRVWNAIPPAKPNSFRAFLITLTKRTALDRLDARLAAKRGGGAQPVSLDALPDVIAGEGSPEEATDARRLREGIRRFLSHLPAETRIIFVERFWFMKTVPEIAEEHCIGQSKVKMTISRTKAKLEEFLREEGLL